MAVRYADAVKNAMLDAYETNIGTAPVLRLYTGSVAGAVGTAPAGTLLAALTLPSDWMNAAATGSKTRLGTWSGTASATGTAGCYTLSTSGGTAIEDGSVGTSSADLILDSVSVVSGATITISTWTKSI